MKKNISIFINSLDSGGAEKIASLLINDLKSEYNLTLLLMNETIKYDLQDFNKIHFLENAKLTENGILKLLKLPLLAWKYKNYCQNNKIDISISLLSRPNYIAILSKLFGNKSTIVISEHSLPSKQYGSHTMQSKINRFLIKTLFNFADKIIAVSDASAIDLKKNFFIEKKIKIVPNCIDIQEIKDKMAEKVNFDFSKFTYITIGRLDAGKNHTMLIKAFAKLDFTAQLIIIGEGELKKELLTLIKKLDLDDKVFLLGYKSNPYKYLSKSDCFVFTSNYESFGIVLLEAMACNLPIIATASKGPIEILNTRCNYEKLLPIDDIKSLFNLMNEIYKNDLKRSLLKNKSQECIKNFINKNIGRDYII